MAIVFYEMNHGDGHFYPVQIHSIFDYRPSFDNTQMVKHGENEHEHEHEKR